MENMPSIRKAEEQIIKFEDSLFKLKDFLESVRRKGFPAWQLDTREIEITVADFELEIRGLLDMQREMKALQAEFEPLKAAMMELRESAEKLEIHNQADYEEAQRLKTEIAAYEQLINAKSNPLIEASEQRLYRLLTLQQRLTALCRLASDV